MPSARDKRYARLSALEVSSFVRDVIIEALWLPWIVQLETLLLLLLYLPLWPFEAFRLGTRMRSPVQLVRRFDESPLDCCGRAIERSWNRLL